MRLMDFWPFGGTCLRRSLLVGNRLRSLGPTIRIGVGPSGAPMAAHAWVEIDGGYFDPEAARFSALSKTAR
jgi:hypothetical protein